MSRFRLRLTVLIVGFGVACAGIPRRDPSATDDILIRGGRVLALDDESSGSAPAAIAIRRGTILFVGAEDEAVRRLSRGAAVIDLAGATVLPAFVDSHIHPIDSGVEFSECYLYALEGIAKVLDKVRECIGTSQTGWIRGSGWDQTLFGNGPPKTNPLDGVETAAPIALMASDGHSYWVNRAALDRAGITAATPDPRDGAIGRIPGSREPNGFLFEGAMELVEKLLPKRTKADERRGLLKALAIMHENGIVSFHDAYATEDHLRLYASMLSHGEIPGLVSAALYADSNRPADPQIRVFRRLRAEFGNERLRVGTIKIFLDGTIEDRTAALLKPYVGVKGHDGRPTAGGIQWARDRLNRMVKLADRDGFQVHFHAIGDAAVRAALDAVERAQRANRTRDRRHQIAHLQLVDPADIPRFARLGVIANFQPLWALRDEFVSKLAEPILGITRSPWIYPIGAIAKSGGRLAFGSDWAVTSLDPRSGIETAIRRADPAASLDSDWTPQHRIPIGPALAGYTTGGAYANFWEGRLGRIRAGLRADLVVLDGDPMETPATKLSELKVLKTIASGKVVFDRANPAPSGKTP